MIEAENLVKDFGSIRAVDHISFELKKGDILGFLGPNGAGKSTTMKIITGFLQPTSGTARIGGQRGPLRFPRQHGRQHIAHGLAAEERPPRQHLV